MQANTNAAVDADSAAAVGGQQEQEAQGLTAEQFLHLFIRWTPCFVDSSLFVVVVMSDEDGIRIEFLEMWE